MTSIYIYGGTERVFRTRNTTATSLAVTHKRSYSAPARAKAHADAGGGDSVIVFGV